MWLPYVEVGVQVKMRFLLLMRVNCIVVMAALLSTVCHAATWFPLGPFGGSARSLVADPADSKHLFLGTATGWIYDSHDGGTSWTRVAQIANRNDLVVDNIVVDRKNPKRLIVAAFTADHLGDGGIFISEDCGKNWYSQAEMRGQSIRALARADSDTNVLVAGTLKGVFRSMDNGIHWKQISPRGSAEIHEVQSIAIDPTDPNVIYAGTWHLPWKTIDGGATWHNIKEGIIDDSDVFSIIVDPKNPETVYASACSGIYKSTNAGELFRKVQGIPSAARRTRKLEQDPGELSSVYAGTTEGLYRTLDAGEKWERLTPADVIVNDVYVDPSNSKHVLIATDRGGVYRSEDGGATFDTSNTGFSARQVTAYAADAKDSNTLYVGVVNDKATGGVFQSTDGAVHWQQQSEGLGGRDVFSLLSLSDGTLLAGTAHGIFRLTDGAWTDSSAFEMTLRSNRQPDMAGTDVPRVIKTARTTTNFRPRGVIAPNVNRRNVALQRGRKPPMVTVHRQGSKQALSTRASRAKAKPSTKPNPKLRDPQVVQVRAKGRSAVQVRSNLKAVPPSVQVKAPRFAATTVRNPTASQAGTKETKSGRLDSVVFSLVRSGDLLFAGSGGGLLRSGDNGQHWVRVGSLDMPEVHFVATLPARDASDVGVAPVVLAASLEQVAMSLDGGATWNSVVLPSGLTQIGAVGVDGNKSLWVGGREGVWFSTDAGSTWKTLRNLFVTQVDNIFYDATQRRVLVTAFTSPVAFSVQLPDYKVTYWDTGWKLRFVRPVGDHLIGATLFDGVVVQPQMVESPLNAQAALK